MFKPKVISHYTVAVHEKNKHGVRMQQVFKCSLSLIVILEALG